MHACCHAPAPAGKAERLRQAKAEAEKEISAYRAEREGAYQKKLAEVSTGCSLLHINPIHSAARQQGGAGFGIQPLLLDVHKIAQSDLLRVHLEVTFLDAL